MLHYERDTSAMREGAKKGYEVLQEMTPNLPPESELAALASKHATEDGFLGGTWRKEYIQEFVNQFIYDMES